MPFRRRGGRKIEKLKVRNFKLMSYLQDQDPCFCFSLWKPVQTCLKHKPPRTQARKHHRNRGLNKNIPFAHAVWDATSELCVCVRVWGGGFLLCRVKKGNDLKTSQHLFSPFISVWMFRSFRQILSASPSRGTAHWQKLWTSPCPIQGFSSSSLVILLTAACYLCIAVATPPGNKEIRSSQRPMYHSKALAKGGL